MGYRLMYDISKTWQVVLRNILLLISVVIDFIMIYNVIRSLLISNMHWIAVSICIVSSLILRIIAIHLCSKIEYEIYNDVFTIKRHYILYSKIILKCDITEINDIKNNLHKSCSGCSKSNDKQRGVF